MNDRKLRKETLAIVNRARKALGEKLLRSLPDGKGLEDSITYALRCAAAGEDVWVIGRWVYFKNPDAAKKVAQAWGTELWMGQSVFYDTVRLPDTIAKFMPYA